MKTACGLGVSTFAIAISLTSAAHAQDGALALEHGAQGEALAAAIPFDLDVVAADVDALDGLLTVKVAKPVVPADVSEVGTLEASVEIEEDAQEAIYLVDFASDGGDDFITVTAQLRSESVIPSLSAPITIEPMTQDAIYGVNFLSDIRGDLVTTPATDFSDWNPGVVTLRSLSANNLTANYGNIDAFYGNIVAFYGNIDAFWGNINPFYGNINPFYGNIDAFWGNINPFYGNIGAFWGDIDAFYGNIGAFTSADLAALGDFWKTAGQGISTANTFWSSANLSGVNSTLNSIKSQAITRFGAKGFTSAKADEVFQRHGITLGNLATLNLTEAQRARFFLDWHDTVNTYSGIDAVDHWMRTVNWTPALTQIQGDGAKTLISVIDSNFRSGDLADNVVLQGYYADGANTTLNGHGSGVASLISAAHDGKGVMGIAPNANIFAFNPFDANGQTTWSRVGYAIQNAVEYNRFNAKINRAQAVSVINLSLGEPGFVASQGLFDTLNKPGIALYKDRTVYVVAAGNEGISQTQNISFGTKTDLTAKTDTEHAVIFVGSVRSDGTISDFSNRPGSACLLDQYGMCRANGGGLMNYFVVAPGELLLVSDGRGSVTRASGTSFAAPLVSGAIALLHDRWPWLQNHAKATTEIIFRSARDLGAPGVDPVYGRGLLDVVASQSPLDFNAMSYTYYVQKGSSWKPWSYDASSVLWNYVPKYWDMNNVFLTAIEQVGDTHRDFLIPGSAFHYGKSRLELGNGYQRMQDFIGDRFTRWAQSGGADKNGDGRAGISQILSGTQEMRGDWSIEVAAIQPRFSEDGSVVPVHNAATLTDPSGKLALTFGHGQGAMALSGSGFGVISDYDPYAGGVNPVLGLASGEMFGQASYKVLPNTKVSLGFSANREDWTEINTDDPLELAARQAMGAREASAMTVGVEQKVSDAVTLNAQWTRLSEDDALFGAQASVLTQGTATEAVTLSASVNLGDGFTFDLSATGATTETAQDQILRNRGDVYATAGQMAVTKQGVMGESDKLRLSVGQPLTIEQGELEFTMLSVIDRQTGELGEVTQSFGIETKRRVAGELVYATPLGNNAEFGLFGRYVSEGGQDEAESVMIGANFGLRF